MSGNTVSISISNNRTYHIGDEIAVSIRISNHNNESSEFPMPVIASGKLKFDLFHVEDEGHNEIGYEGLLVKARRTVVVIEPGESIEFPIFMAREYSFVKEGNYSFKTDYFKAFTIEEEIHSSFELTAGNAYSPVLTWSASFLKTNVHGKYLAKTFDTHDVIRATDEQFVDLKNAHRQAINALDYIGNQLDGAQTLPKTLVNHYQKLFCSASVYWEDTLAKYTSIRNYMQTKVKYWFKHPDCDAGLFGFVYKEDPNKNIYLCDAYDDAHVFPDNKHPYDTKTGVIIHEVSHKAVDSEDYFYGYEDCLDKAKYCNKNSMPETCDNADCIQMFAEVTFVGADEYNPKDEL